ncbi:conjugal transfer protein [Streptomyces mirabilis]|uniref:conjugal transfer protein n=1 Tax=Streptomyces mirabilis TaxID=68239 RepID=UPI00368CAA78
MSRRTRPDQAVRAERGTKKGRRAAVAVEPDSVEAVDAVEGGWVTVSSGAVANLTTLLRWGAWLLLLVGPLLGILAFMRPTVAAGTAPPLPKTPLPATAADTAGPAGFAQLYVAAYVEAGKGTEASLAPYFPEMRNISLEATPHVQQADRLAAVRVARVSSGYWSVTVAARITSTKASKKASTADTETDAASGALLRYFQVPVKSAGSGGGFVAAALPAEVAAPNAGEGLALDYGTPVPADTHDAATAAVGEFLGAYLSGSGELDRYLSPGTDLAAVSPAPYERIEVSQLAERGGDFHMAAPATEGARRQLLVDIWATGSDGQVRPLTYAIALKARDGRWEIAALDAAPGLSTTSKEK